MSRLTWLHLSDLHACNPKTGWDAGRVTETLIKDLRDLQEKHGLRPDLIFFTGDAAFGEIGSKREETIAGQLEKFGLFLEAVRTAFEPAIEIENVFLVPGNHDVNRGEATDDQTEWLDNRESLEPVQRLIHQGGRQWRRSMERLADYRAFLEACGFNPLLDDLDRLIYATVREVRGLRVGIAGFNTAWSCGRNGERGRLWMAGKWQQGTLRSKLGDADFSIALLHHPPDWLGEYETPDFGRGLEHDFRFLLHGHEHREWVLATQDGCSVIAAGSRPPRAAAGARGAVARAAPRSRRWCQASRGDPRSERGGGFARAGGLRVPPPELSGVSRGAPSPRPLGERARDASRARREVWRGMVARGDLARVGAQQPFTLRAVDGSAARPWGDPPRCRAGRRLPARRAGDLGAAVPAGARHRARGCR